CSHQGVAAPENDKQGERDIVRNGHPNPPLAWSCRICVTSGRSASPPMLNLGAEIGLAPRGWKPYISAVRCACHASHVWQACGFALLPPFFAVANRWWISYIVHHKPPPMALPIHPGIRPESLWKTPFRSPAGASRSRRLRDLRGFWHSPISSAPSDLFRAQEQLIFGNGVVFVPRCFYV